MLESDFYLTGSTSLYRMESNQGSQKDVGMGNFGIAINILKSKIKGAVHKSQK